MTQFTTLKEYDNAVRASQRKLKALNEAYWETKGEFATQELELAKAAHKFLLACRSKFKETGVAPSADVLKAGGLMPRTQGDTPITAPDLSQAPKLRPEQELALREAFERMPDPVLVREYRKPTAAEPQAPTPIDRAREFVPQARIIRERSHAGAMREPKYAADDCRSAGLGYKRVHRKGEAWRRTVALAVAPKFPSERYFTQRAMPNHSKRRITVNGQAWA